MDQLTQLIQQGSTHAWLFLPAAILLGALHGLEPGHSKTMMAAFIIAIRGTIPQAIMLGLAATFSHTLIIWLLAAIALHYGGQLNAETTEPYFQLISAVLIAGMALWMAWRTRRDVLAEAAHGHHHDHSHSHDHGHPHQGHDHGHPHSHDHGHPHLGHDHGHPHNHDHGHPHSHDHGHPHAAPPAALQSITEYQDDHEKAHAMEIEQRFAGRPVTNGQIILFGLTGGLMPCPAAFTILLICLQLKRFALGMSMVLAFSVGLALTLVVVGVIAAWGVQHASKRIAGFGMIARRLPYLSSVVLLVISLYVGWQGWQHLSTPH